MYSRNLLNICLSGYIFIYASNEPKSVLARDLGDYRDNLRNSQSKFLIVELLTFSRRTHRVRTGKMSLFTKNLSQKSI